MSEDEEPHARVPMKFIHNEDFNSIEDYLSEDEIEVWLNGTGVDNKEELGNFLKI